MQKDIIEKFELSISEKDVDDIVLKFYKINDLDDKIYLKDARIIVRERGLSNTMQLMKDI